MCFRLTSTLNTLENADGNDSIGRFIPQKPPFSPSTLEMERFQKGLLLKLFSKASVFISVFGRFSAYDVRKRFKKSAVVRKVSQTRMELILKQNKKIQLKGKKIDWF